MWHRSAGLRVPVAVARDTSYCWYICCDSPSLVATCGCLSALHKQPLRAGVGGVGRDAHPTQPSPKGAGAHAPGDQSAAWSTGQNRASAFAFEQRRIAVQPPTLDIN